MRADRHLRSIVAALSCALALSACSSDPVEKLWAYRSHAAGYSSPAVRDNVVVFGTTAGEVHALSRDGAFLWKFQTRKEIVSAPQIIDNLILFGSTNHNFYAIDLKGRQTWKYTTFSRIKGDANVDRETRTVYFGSYDKHLYALDAISRGERWIFPPQSADDRETAADQGGTPPAPPAEDAAEGGEAAPVIDRSQWPADAFSYAQPTLTSNGLVVIGNLDGHLYALDKKTGALAWRWGAQGATARRGITSTVFEHEGVLYFGANDGKVHAIKLSDQSDVWTFETGGEVNSSPVIDATGTLYVGSLDHKLYALDAKTGQKKWEMTAQGPIVSRPALYQDKLVLIGAGEGDGHVYAVNTANGEVYWKYKTDDKIEADVLVDGDRFYVASGDKHLYAFRVNKLP